MKARILLVDDEETILFAMADYLTFCGYQVDCAREQQEAEALLSAHEYLGLITDLRLTGSDDIKGINIIDYALQHRPATRRIVLTAYGSPEVELVARKRGANAFLHKPKPLREVAEVLSGL